MVILSESAVRDALRTVNDPELHKDLVTLNMVKQIRIDGSDVKLVIELTTPACPLKGRIGNDVEQAIRSRISGVGAVSIQWTARVQQDQRLHDSDVVRGIGNILAVSSGKGGVGKSTVAVNLAAALARSGARVGILDADIYGPNVPAMLRSENGPLQREVGGEVKLVPPTAYGISVMSMGFLIPPDEAVIWRGPMIHSAIRQFFTDVVWGELDYLFVDLPPGTGDAQMSISQLVPLSGAIIVTTPQDVALLDSGRGLAMFRRVNTPVIGIVENMSYYECPKCGNREDLFSHGGGRSAAARLGVPFLGEVPIQIQVRIAGDEGMPIVLRDPESPAARALITIASTIAAQLAVRSAQASEANV